MRKLRETSQSEELAAILERGESRKRLPEPAMRRYLREQNGLRQRDIRDGVEALTGRAVARETVGRWESGARTPRGDLLAAYVSILTRLAAEMGEP